MSNAPRRIPVQFMAVGYGNRKDGHYYTPEAVRDLVPLIQAQPKMYLSHSLPSEVRERGHRALEQLAGIADRATIRFNPTTQATEGDVVLRPRMAEYVDVAREAGDTIGVSIDAVGQFRQGPKGKECAGWAGFNSADFVPQGGAGGFTLDVREADSSPALMAEEKEFTMGLLDELTPAEVRENDAALYEAIGKEWAEAHPVRDAAPQTPPAEFTQLVRENAALKERLDVLDAEKNRAQSAQTVIDTLRAAKLPHDKAAAYVARNFEGVTVGPDSRFADKAALEEAVRESATAYLASLPPAPTATGMIEGLGGGWPVPTLGETTAPTREAAQTEGSLSPAAAINDAVASIFGLTTTTAAHTRQ